MSSTVDEDLAAVVARAAALVAEMTLQEKASLCQGRSSWQSVAIERLGIAAVTVADGPHGMRVQPGDDGGGLGLTDSLPATCFPTASALAATWDVALVAEVGAAIATEARAQGVDVVLGPGANLKRSPLCGRNFEYFSEDPFLTGAMATAHVQGVQSTGAGASLKHFAVNNQEYRRLTIDAVVDQRTLRELYLAGFEQVVRVSRPWTVMCAYNRLNGTYASDNEWLLTDVLRGEWGHEGIVVTDWGAMNDRVAAIAAGCELEMPGPVKGAAEVLVDAVQHARLPERLLDRAATRMVTLALRAAAHRDPDATFDPAAHHALARRVAAEAAVLLRNEARALPLSIDGDERVALVGDMAVRPRYQGTGSSQINPTRLDDLRSELTALLGEERVTFVRGYDGDEVDDELLAEAVAAATDHDVVVVAVGLPNLHENEGNDRDHLGLPRSHDALVSALAAAHDRVVVVLSNGAPVLMPWVEDVAAVVEGYLGGQAGAGGVADVLTGRVAPAGRLAETFPRHLDDVPSTANFPGGPRTVEYREGLHVGYRFHETVAGDVLFPFGHGLGYAPVSWGPVAVDRDVVDDGQLRAGATVRVTVPLTNEGEIATREVVQVYVRDVEAAVHRPDRELKGFAKVALEPGETATAVIELDRRAFAWWDVQAGDWTVETGAFEVLAAASARDVRSGATVSVTGADIAPRDEPAVHRHPPHHLDVDRASFEAVLGRPAPPNPPFSRPWTRNTPIAATTETVPGRLLAMAARRGVTATLGDDPSTQPLVRAMVEEAPLRSLLMAGLSVQQLDTLVELLNGHWGRGARHLLDEVLAALRAD